MCAIFVSGLLSVEIAGEKCHMPLLGSLCSVKFRQIRGIMSTQIRLSSTRLPAILLAVLIVVAGLGTLPASATGSNEVIFPDANLRAVVASELGLAAGEPITEADLASLTSLFVWDSGISDLTGLEHASNIIELHVSGNQVSDISPLAGITNLTYLSLSNNQLTDLTPLAGLTNLVGLRLSDNQLTDVSGLETLTNLIGLGLSGNQLTDVSGLETLTNLTVLDLSKNHLSDLSPLAGLTNLTHLRLSDNQITDISPLTVLTGLYKLDIIGNPLGGDNAPLIESLEQSGTEVEGARSVSGTVTGVDRVKVIVYERSGSDWVEVDNLEILDGSYAIEVPASGVYRLEAFQVDDSGSKKPGTESLFWGGDSLDTAADVEVKTAVPVTGIDFNFNDDEPEPEPEPEPSVPVAPAQPSIVADGGVVNVSWQAPSDGGSPITGYTVTLTPLAGDPISADVSGDVNKHVFTDVPAGSWTASVSASNKVGVSPASPASQTVLVTQPVSALLPPQLTGLKTLGTSKSLTLWWKADLQSTPAVAHVLTYVKVREADGSVVNGPRIQVALNTVRSGHTINGLEKGATYRVYLRSRDANGNVSPALAFGYKHK